MPTNPIDEIDFEYWTELASNNPQKFEQLRQDKISELIEKAPTKRQRLRLQGLQWQIDQIRGQHKESAMAACLAISELMWDTFGHLSELLHSQSDNGLSAATPAMQDNIIPFPVNLKA